MFRKVLTALSSTIVLIAAVSAAAPAAPPVAPVGQVAGGSTPSFTRIYRGDDGGALYLRQLGSKVYGFGEHPGVDPRYAYVLTGTISGDRLVGSFWDVPKGSRATAKSTLSLKWSQLGGKLVRSGGGDLGPDTFETIPATGIPWPNMQTAGFQATTASDLDGVFVGDDASRHYVREIGGDVVWVGERGSQPGERPGWVTVFIGKRSMNGTAVGGTYVDVPKGIELRSGPFGAGIVNGKRDLYLSQPGVNRTDKLVPDYALDWDRFATEMQTRLSGNVVGYAYAIARNGAFMRMGAGGLRRLAIDGGARSFTTYTQAQTASAAKTINATAIIMALNDRGLTVDAKVKPFLPSCLKLGKSMSTLTFRHILSHTSGLPKVSCNGGSPYDCLVKMLKEGRTQPFDVSYNTHAYDLLRWLVPLVENTSGWKAQFELFDCKNKAGILNRKVSERFARYMFDKVLDPVGADASFYPSGDYSLNYDFSDQTIKGEKPRIDFFERAGSGKLTMSVRDYIRFLSALEAGEIIPKHLVQSMKGSPGNRLGFDSSWAGAVTGGYVWKNGGCPDFDNKSRGCKTAAMIFPSGIVAYVATNSDNNGYPGSIQGVLAGAFDAALR
jgi:CubicO group peptidase (beta-lactamase class C family)